MQLREVPFFVRISKSLFYKSWNERIQTRKSIKEHEKSIFPLKIRVRADECLNT